MNSQILLSPPHMGRYEREMLVDAFDSNWIATVGPHVDNFEAEFAQLVGCQHALAVSSGTAALHLALMAAGVGPGDVVLTSTLTFVASANAIRYVGGIPIFLDSDRETWNLDPNLLEDELKRRAANGALPKAALVVDVCGQAADWAPIQSLCRKYGVTMIEDAAESLGATYRGSQAGSLGDIGCFSFNGNKIITTSGGGMLVTNDPKWAKQARHIATQARDPAPHYEHTSQGYNYRLSNLLSAIGRAQLQQLDDRVAARRRNFEVYRSSLEDHDGFVFMPEASYGRSTRWLTCMTFDPQKTHITPAQVIAALADDQIEARPMWKPMHLQPLFSNCEVRGGEVAEEIFQRGCCLPSGSSMSRHDLARVVDILLSLAAEGSWQLAASALAVAPGT